jgi:hypothetical protein
MTAAPCCSFKLGINLEGSWSSQPRRLMISPSSQLFYSPFTLDTIADDEAAATTTTTTTT